MKSAILIHILSFIIFVGIVLIILYSITDDGTININVDDIIDLIQLNF